MKFFIALVISLVFVIKSSIGSRSNEVVFLWNRPLVAFVDKLSSTTVDLIRSEGELKNCSLYRL